MKTLLVALLFVAPAFAEQCEVTAMETKSRVADGSYYTHDYGHGTIVTTGGPDEIRRHVYTVRMGSMVYEVAARHHQLPMGAADCQFKKNKALVNGLKFVIESERVQ